MADARRPRDNLTCGEPEEAAGQTGAAGSADGVSMMAAPGARWTRLTRTLGIDRNPLRRRADLVAAWLVPGALAALVLLGPLAAAGASFWVHADSAAAHRAEQSWHRVGAVLLQDAPGPILGNGPNAWIVWTPARWRLAGRQHDGPVPVDAGTRAGVVVPVWLDRAGTVQPPPLTPGQVSYRATLAAATAVVALAVLLACLTLLGRWVLDRRRLAAWETAWRSVGPQWSRQP